MLSVSEVMVSTSLEVLVTTTEKVKVPPGSVRLAGVTSLMTRMVGSGVRVTTASSVSVTSTPWGFSPTTVTMSVWEAPATPKKSPGKVQA